MKTRAALAILKRFLGSPEGGDAAEYVLIGAVLVSGIVAGGGAFAAVINNMYSWLATVVSGALSGA